MRLFTRRTVVNIPHMKSSSIEIILRLSTPIYLSTLALFMALSPCLGQATASEAGVAFAQNKLLGRGVNVLGYDPIWQSFARRRFKQRYFKMIHDGGFNTLRVNLSPFRHMGPAPDFALGNSWWQTTEWIVTNALAANLNLILDCHEYGSMGKDPEGNQARFLAFWRQVAPHFKDAPDKVFFEILNEPNGKLTPEVWNQYLAAALAVIRESNPTRTVIIGPAFYNSVDHLDELKLPGKDRNLIVTVHYYKPMKFTHQGAPWVHQENKIGVVWQGTPEERAAIDADFRKVQQWAEEHNRPIFLGEFGAYDKGGMASRVRWTDFVSRTAEKYGWSWAYWQFDSDFILYDIPKEQWVAPIHDALIPASSVETP
jgi:endoglucanase